MTKNCRQISGFSRIDPADEQRKSMVVEQKNINRLITKCNNRSDCSFSRLQGSLLTADRRLAAQLGGPLLVSESLIYWIMCVAWSRPLKVSQKCNNALSVDNSKKNRLLFSLSFHHDVKKNFIFISTCHAHRGDVTRCTCVLIRGNRFIFFNWRLAAGKWLWQIHVAVNLVWNLNAPKGESRLLIVTHVESLDQVSLVNWRHCFIFWSSSNERTFVWRTWHVDTIELSGGKPIRFKFDNFRCFVSNFCWFSSGRCCQQNDCGTAAGCCLLRGSSTQKNVWPTFSSPDIQEPEKYFSTEKKQTKFSVTRSRFRASPCGLVAGKEPAASIGLILRI